MLTLESEFHDTCPGCGTGLHKYHGDYCDVARCAVTGHQLFSCSIFALRPDHDCVHITWSGYWPGVEECFENGLFAYFVPYKGFLPCAPDHPEAVCDLNYLVSQFRWDAKIQKWVKP